MLQRVWGNGEPPTLLVGMQTGVAATEKSKEIPKQKKKQLSHHMIQQSFSWARF